MKRHIFPFVWLCVLGLSMFAGSSCKKKPALVPQEPAAALLLRQGHQFLAAGDSLRAAESYERYLKLSDSPEEREAVVLRLALLYLVPGNEAENPERARTLLSSFSELHPDASLGAEMRLVLEMSTHLDRARISVRESSSEAENHRLETAGLQAKVQMLTARLKELEGEKESLVKEKELLESHLKLRSERIHQLVLELQQERRRKQELVRLVEELKEIDLQRRRPR